jgi:hypothetical protein
MKTSITPCCGDTADGDPHTMGLSVPCQPSGVPPEMSWRYKRLSELVANTIDRLGEVDTAARFDVTKVPGGHSTRATSSLGVSRHRRLDFGVSATACR